jgi:hypothetical protein
MTTALTDQEFLEKIEAIQSINAVFEALHSTALINTVSVYTGSDENIAAAVTVLRQITSGFNSVAIFNENGLQYASTYLQEPLNLSVALLYTQQMLKHDRDVILTHAARMIADAWKNGYTVSMLSETQCRDLLEKETPMLMIFMCMLYPNATIGVVSGLKASK